LKGLQERIREARESGLRELAGGEAEGQVLPPHVFADVTNEHPVAREELFGPIAPIIRAHGEEDALRIEAGMAHVNDQPVNDCRAAPSAARRISASVDSTASGR
jgi:aldehyde dehydrogenase (NAD+)